MEITAWLNSPSQVKPDDQQVQGTKLQCQLDHRQPGGGGGGRHEGKAPGQPEAEQTVQVFHVQTVAGVGPL